MALGLAVVLLNAAAGLQVLGALGLRGDAGIQFELARQTADGALPLRDFAHTWNAGAWWWLGVMRSLADGDATVWSWLVGLPMTRLLVGLGVLAAGVRMRLPGPLLVAVLAATALLADPPSIKYALPALWLLVALPVGRLGAGWPAVALRVLLGAVTALSHVEMAVLLAAGVALFDLVDAPRRRRLHAVVRAGAAPAGAALALAGQVLVYDRLGVPADALLGVLRGSEGTSEATSVTYDAALLRPEILLGAWFPVLTAAPFVPAVWRRLPPGGRLAACLGVATAVVALRKGDAGHVMAATSLLPFVTVLAASGLVASPLPVRPALRRPLGLLGGLLAVVAVGVAAVSVRSLAVAGVLLLAAGLASLLARRAELPAASLGALAALLVAGLAGSASVLADVVRADRPVAEGALLSEAVAATVDRCVAPDRRAWVLPEPLALYEELDLENPTPYYLFWGGVDDETVIEQAREGRLGTVVEVGVFPPSARELGEWVRREWSVCGSVRVPATAVPGGQWTLDQRVTVWTPDGRRAPSAPTSGP